MSGARAAIARLSLVLRGLLYTILLVAIGYVGFSYSSGFIAIPGDMAFTMPMPPGAPDLPGGGNVIFLRTDVICEKSTEDGRSGEQTPDCVTAAPIANFNGKYVLRLKDQSIDVTIERAGEGKDAKGHITLRTGGKVIESDFTGVALPDAIASALPADKKAKIEEMLQHPPAPPMPTRPVIFFERAAPAPRAQRSEAAPQDPSVAGDGAVANGPAPLGQSGDDPPPPLPPGAEGPAIIGLPPGAGDFNLPIPAPGARMQVMSFTGPALLQQQLRGHTAIRATLVGITIALVILAIIQLERLLAHFQKAELFSSRNSGLLRNIGLLLIGIAFVQAASTLLPAILVKALHPVLIGALGPHLFLVFAGLVLCLLAQVMSEGGKLEDEAAHTV